MLMDESDYAIGTVLFKIRENAPDRIMALVSRTLRGPELRHSATEKEALAIVGEIFRLKSYLSGREFTIRTDHMALILFINVPYVE